MYHNKWYFKSFTFYCNLSVLRFFYSRKHLLQNHLPFTIINYFTTKRKNQKIFSLPKNHSYFKTYDSCNYLFVEIFILENICTLKPFTFAINYFLRFYCWKHLLLLLIILSKKKRSHNYLLSHHNMWYFKPFTFVVINYFIQKEVRKLFIF